VATLNFSRNSRYDLGFPLTRFQSDGNHTQEVVHSVGCARYGQEAGLEAIRMALDGKGNMEKECDDPNDCEITWRSGSKRVIIMITDEDSDLPTNK
jgi:hypothetical protein